LAAFFHFFHIRFVGFRFMLNMGNAHINHFFSGVFFACLVVWFRIPSPLLTYVLVHTLWELWQIAIGMTPLSPRGYLDIVVDTVVGVLGYWLTVFLIRKQ
jgi:hypothetical protein